MKSPKKINTSSIFRKLTAVGFYFYFCVNCNNFVILSNIYIHSFLKPGWLSVWYESFNDWSLHGAWIWQASFFNKIKHPTTLFLIYKINTKQWNKKLSFKKYFQKVIYNHSLVSDRAHDSSLIIDTRNFVMCLKCSWPLLRWFYL